jgi:hypothetical protein
LCMYNLGLGTLVYMTSDRLKRLGHVGHMFWKGS